ncbi:MULTISPECIES: DoxX family protein [unclassified Burkholderia]|uniref:DoxX family protein n=1 Tax=unclassified Burkholderia TaxID=2613784 RepID=UPI002ABDFE6B|nr:MULTISPECIES: DoxX family protein [unclassified Burkholderia]
MTSQAIPPAVRPASATLKIMLWIAQSLIFAAFVFFGFQKLSMPPEALAAMWNSHWPVEHPQLLRMTGLIDTMGGLGILLPSLTRILPHLTVWAARGCVVLQILAVVFHVSRGEVMVTPLNFVLLALCGFILWGRSARVPVASRR